MGVLVAFNLTKSRKYVKINVYFVRYYACFNNIHISTKKREARG